MNARDGSWLGAAAGVAAGERVRIDVDGGAAQVVAHVFAPPPGVAARAAVLIGGAMGVRQSYYRPFAAWLARRGQLVATFDYRGVGDSRAAEHARSLRGLDADLHAWARDTDAVLAALAARAPGAPLVIVGHSLGGQLPGMLAQRARLAGIVGIATGSGYWRDNAPALKRKALWFWHLLVPLGIALFGWFPGRRIGAVGDLPRGVVLQWRRWCLDPRYHVGAEGPAFATRFAEVRCPIVALSVTDDEMMTERGTGVLLDAYPGAPRRLERLAPADAGAERIGHFGFFRERFEATLWPRALALLPLQETPP
jgi:predicted alpha/beta hydrolase